MPFTRPTLEAQRQQARAAFEARLPGADAGLRFSALNILADLVAGAAHLQHGHLDWTARQVIPDSADAEYLTRWASIFGLARKPAAQATGNVTLTGISGTTLPAGRTLTRADGTAYLTLADATIGGGGSVAVAVRAVAGGLSGNAAAGVRLTLSVAVVGIEGSATVATGGLSAGADEEADAELRARLLARIRQPPQGGAERDYIAWALELPGVTRAWAYSRRRGAGTVDVFFAYDGRANIIPEPADVTAMQALLDLRRPVTADVLAIAPTPVALNVTISGLSPSTTEIRAAIQVELADQIRRDAAPGGTIFRSRLVEAISRAAGEFSHTLSVPSGNVTHAANAMAVLGTVTFS
jgi:uncharacterized phage protein gp47/JayE